MQVRVPEKTVDVKKDKTKCGKPKMDEKSFSGGGEKKRKEKPVTSIK